MMAIPIPSAGATCPVVSKYDDGGTYICGAPLELAERHENVTLFHLAKGVEPLPDGRKMVTACNNADGLISQSSETQRWIRCRLGHYVEDLLPDAVIKWES